MENPSHRATGYRRIQATGVQATGVQGNREHPTMPQNQHADVMHGLQMTQGHLHTLCRSSGGVELLYPPP